MNGKQAKFVRQLARGCTEVHSEGMVAVKGTSRVRTASNGTKVQTATLAHPKGSYRNLLKFLKGRGGYELFDPATGNHALEA